VYPSGRAAEHHHAVTEINSFIDVVCDENKAGSRARVNPQQFILQRRLGHGIERTKWLVHHQHVRLQRECARYLHALLHAAGQLPGMVVSAMLKPNHFQRFVDTFVKNGGHNTTLEPERDIAGDGTPLQKRSRIVLEYDDDTFGRAVDRLSAKANAAIGRRRQAAEQPQQGRFAGARTTYDCQEFAAEYVEPDRFEDRAIASGQLNAIVEITTFKDGFLTWQRLTPPLSLL
jgi:hypothetical protein